MFATSLCFATLIALWGGISLPQRHHPDDPHT